MGVFQPEIEAILADIRCEVHICGMVPTICHECKIYEQVKKTLNNLDEAHEVSMMACAIKQSAIQLLQMWMEHAKGCKAKPEDNCKYCIHLATAATNEMKKAESNGHGKEMLERMKKVEAAAEKIDKLAPELWKSVNASEKKIKDLTLIVQRYYMTHSLAKGDKMCLCDICKDARGFINPSTIA
jgi:hypothetical protein